MLTLLGGLSGLALGIGGCLVMAEALGWAISIPPEVLAAAPASAALVGVICGFYPARLASRLSPIEALRHE